MEKVKTSITMDKDLYDEIVKLSEKEERSFSQQISFIAKEYIAKLNQNRG